MRIGIDARLWNESGVGRYIRNLVKYLAQIDKTNEYVIFAKTSDISNIKYTNQWKMIVGKWKVVKADIHWHTVEEQLKMPLILKHEKLDLVHFPYFSVPIFYPGKFIITIHDLIPLHFATGRATTLPALLYKLKRLGYKLIIRNAAKRAKKIITVSEATKEEIVKHLGVEPEKVVVTHEGIDEQIRNSKFEIRNNYQNTKYKILNTKYFLYVGNAYPHKNLERLVEAFKNIYTLTPKPYTLVFVGKEDYFYKTLREKVKRMRCKNNIVFYGEATDDELQSLYKNARALVIPSFMEGFGLPAVEAMKNKCLVLCSDIAALREICADSAIYFNPYDVVDIAEKMKSIYFDYSNNRTRILEGKKIAKLFSWRKMAKVTLAVYKSV